MDDAPWNPGRYTLGKLRQELDAHLPEVARWVPHLRPPRGERLEWSSRLAAQLRQAKLLGCPVCLKVFPPLGPRAGLSSREIDGILAGDLTGLPVEAAGAAAWVEALIRADGREPAEIPEAAQVLTAGQREHLAAMVRLELLVHSVGLFFLPHSLIEQALRG
jgi:hypothetical protein